MPASKKLAVRSVSPRPDRDPLDTPAHLKGKGGPMRPARPMGGRASAPRPAVQRAVRPAINQPIRRPVAPAPMKRAPSRPVVAPPARGVPMNRRPAISTASPMRSPQAVNRGIARTITPAVGGRATPQITRPASNRGLPNRPPAIRPNVAGMRRPGGAPVAPRPAQPNRRAGEAVVLGAILAGAGMALAPEVSSALSGLNMKIDQLNNQAAFTDVQGELNTLQVDIDNLVTMLDDVRDRGYIYGKALEGRVNDVAGRWQAVADGVYNQLNARQTEAYDAIYPLQSQIEQASRSVNPSAINQLNSQVDRQLSQLSSAASSVRQQYSPISSEISAIKSELTRIDWLLDNLEEASFELAEGEHPVACSKAVFDIDGKEDPNGFLFLTNQRVVYERKEKVATKKVLFITTEAELVQQVMIDEDIDHVAEVKSVKKGLFGGDSHLELKFSGGKLPEAKIDVQGQDSDLWVTLINSVKRGDIENDKATVGGLSVRDINAPVTASSIVDLQQEVNELQARTQLTFANAELGELDNLVGSLDRDLQDTRAAGYLFESDLEGTVQSLANQWATVRDRANAQVTEQGRRLGDQMQTIQTKLAAVVGYANNPEAVRPQVLELRSLIASAEGQAATAESAVAESYADFQADVTELSARFAWIGWMMEALAQAAWRLYPTEGGVAASEAIWRQDGGQEIPGVLFLTDQRFIFEEHEGEFSVMIEVPLNHLENVAIEDVRDQGKEEEQLILQFAAESSSPVRKATFLLMGPTNEEWQVYIGRARNGDYVNDRAEKIDPAEIERLKNAPTACSACGATFTEPLMRGQTEINCGFCGAVTRV